MIEKAWAQPIDELETLALRHPVQDPLLRSAMHIRSGLVISSNAVAVHQDRTRSSPADRQGAASSYARPGWRLRTRTLKDGPITTRAGLARAMRRLRDDASHPSLRAICDAAPGAGACRPQHPPAPPRRLATFRRRPAGSVRRRLRRRADGHRGSARHRGPEPG
jgi:hypothetical protein